MSYLNERLRHEPSAPVAVDLEGMLNAKKPKIDLIQIAVDENEGHPSLCYVFNVHHDRKILADRQPGSVRELLQGRATKVLHCCRGDAAALFTEFGIGLRNAFDTSVADSILNGRHYNTQRGLDKVLFEWLGDEVVHLTHKGKLVHVPFMFQEWPLSRRLFVYSAEDVLYLGALYRRFLEELEQEGLTDLVFECTRQRCISGRQRDEPASTLVIALTDGEAIVCIQENGRDSLPCTSISGNETPLELKRIASETWKIQMGAPPKGGIASAINGSLQKPMRVGDVIVLVAQIKECARWLPSLSAAREVAATKNVLQGQIVLRTCGAGRADAGVFGEHALAFQYLAAEARRVAPTLAQTAMITEVDSSLQVRVRLTEHNGRVRLSMYSIQAPAADFKIAESAVVVGPSSTGQRAAAIISDGASAYLLSRMDLGSSEPHWAFPSHKVEIGETPAEAAVKAIDLWAGAAVHKGGEEGAVPSTFALCPKLSRKVCASINNMQTLGEIDGVFYFGFKIEDMREHLACFHAARREGTIASFRLTEQQKLQYSGFEILRLSSILSGVGGSDIKAAAAAKEQGFLNECFGATVPYQAPAKSKKTKRVAEKTPSAPAPDPALVAPGSTSEETGESSADAATVSHEVKTAGNEHLSDMDAAVEDADGRLIEAATLLHLAAALEDNVAMAGGLHLPRNGDTDATGAPPKFRAPDASEICEEQRRHPALRPIVLTLMLLAGEDAGETGAPLPGSPEYAEFAKELDLHKLQEDTGLLLRWCTPTQGDGGPKLEPMDIESGYRIVLPPKFHSYAFTAYHDRVGHLGINRCLPLLCRRYYWGTVGEMRNGLSGHINNCLICRRCKISRHRRGEGTLVTNGEWPFDIVSADHMSVGRESRVDATDERISTEADADAEDNPGTADAESSRYFDGTVTFADQFTRLIVCAAVKGQPTAQMISRLLIREVIRVYGTPRHLRSDRGSNFVAAATKVLYDAFGIEMQSSSSYHHSTVGLVERWHSCLRALLLTHRIGSGKDQWHLYLPLLELIFNSTVNSALGYSPFFLNHLFHPRLPSDALVQKTLRRMPIAVPDWVRQALHRLDVVYDEVGRTLKTNALHVKRVYDLKRDVVTEFAAGDRVLLVKGKKIDGKLPKSEEPTEGPFTVVKRVSRNRYVLMGAQSRKVKHPVHIDRMVLYPSRKTIPDAELAGMFPVKRVCDRRIVEVPGEDGSLTREVQYKLQWIGFGKKYPYWYPMEYLHNIAELVADYNANAPPLPAELAAPPLEYESRDIDPDQAVPADDEARRRPHFRSTVTRPAEEDVPPAPLQPGAIADPFPAGTRVEHFYTKVDQYWGGTGVDAWLPATVQSTRIFRPRDRRARPERRLTLVYDCDPQDPKTPYEVRVSSHLRQLSAVEEAPVATEPAVRQSPRLRGAATAAFAWAEPRWVECPHQGAVLVAGSGHSLPFRHHRCTDSSCVANAFRLYDDARHQLGEKAMSEATKAGRPIGAIYSREETRSTQLCRPIGSYQHKRSRF